MIQRKRTTRPRAGQCALSSKKLRASVNVKRREVQVGAGCLWRKATRERHGQLDRVSDSMLYDLAEQVTERFGIDSLLLLSEEARDSADAHGLKTLAELLARLERLEKAWPYSNRRSLVRRCFANSARLASGEKVS